MTSSYPRNSEIDGIRGWAAFFVLVFHFYYETFNPIVPALKSNLFSFAFNGYLMVCIFFVLSGDALSMAFFYDRKVHTTTRLVISRYLRLTFPIFVSCLLIYLSMKLKIVHNIAASELVQRQDWLGAWVTFQPSLPGVIRFALGDVFFKGTGSYNPFLWTMPIELLGSVLVFLNCFVLREIKPNLILKTLICEFLFFWVFSQYAALFVLGMALGYLRINGAFNKLRSGTFSIISMILFILMLFISPIYKNQLLIFFKLITHDHIHTDSFYFFIAGVIVFSIYSNSYLIAFFSTKLSQFLGKLSFPVYVLQFNILITYTSWLIIKFHNLGILQNWYFIIPTSSIVVTFIAANYLNIIEKKFMRRINKIITNRILNPSL